MLEPLHKGHHRYALRAKIQAGNSRLSSTQFTQPKSTNNAPPLWKLGHTCAAPIDMRGPACASARPTALACTPSSEHLYKIGTLTTNGSCASASCVGASSPASPSNSACTADAPSLAAAPDSATSTSTTSSSVRYENTSEAPPCSEQSVSSEFNLSQKHLQTSQVDCELYL